MAPIKEVRDGRSTCLRCRHLKSRHDNQPIDGAGGVGGTGEAMRTGRNAWGRMFAHRFRWQMERQKKENREGNGASDFDGYVEWRDATTNQKSAASLEYIWARRRAGEDDLGGRSHSFSAFGLWGKKINKTKFVMALEGRQSTISHDNQPNNRGNDGG